MSDAVIVGGGVIGLTLAWELARQGISVSLFDQQQIGKEASWAGAGILPPGNLEYASSAESSLRSLSHSLWQKFSESLLAETGIDNGYRPCGGAEILPLHADPKRIEEDLNFWQSEGVKIQKLSREELKEVEPAVHAEATGGYLLPELSQVRNPRHLKALQTACLQRGVEFHAGTPVLDFLTDGELVQAVRTPSGLHSAEIFCVAAGAWSRMLLSSLKFSLPVYPVRGQIVQLSVQPLPFKRVLQVGPRYLVPRPDGRILIGSTEEDCDFDQRNTAEGVAGLLEFATSVVPVLGSAKFERAWAGLRPGSPNGVPYLGLAPGYRNLFIGAGHFRSGLQMSPGTGVHLRQLMMGESTTLPAELYQW